MILRFSTIFNIIIKNYKYNKIINKNKKINNN